MNEDLLFHQLESLRWSRDQIELGLRDDFKCRYCRKDLLKSVDDFKEWTLDHIAPRSKLKEGADDPQNIAVACWTCNIIKRQWDPRSHAVSTSRDDLIRATEAFLKQKRAHLDEELSTQRDLIARLRALQHGL